MCLKLLSIMGGLPFVMAFGSGASRSRSLRGADEDVVHA